MTTQVEQNTVKRRPLLTLVTLLFLITTGIVFALIFDAQTMAEMAYSPALLMWRLATYAFIAFKAKGRQRYALTSFALLNESLTFVYFLGATT